MNISEEAIEAARDAYESGVDEAIRRGIESTSHYFGIKYALEAAAPLLVAQAWDEGQQAGYENAYYQQAPPVEPNTNPYKEQL